MANETQADACPTKLSEPESVNSAVRVGDLNWMSVVSILAIFAAFDFLYFPVFQAVAPRPSFTAIAVYIFVFGSSPGFVGENVQSRGRKDLRSGSTKGGRPYHLRRRIDPRKREARADATTKAEGAHGTLY